LVHDFGGRGVLDAMARARPMWVLAAFGGASACVVLGAVRWALVLRALGYRVGLGRLLVVMLATWPPAVVVPSRANEVLRAVALRGVVPLAVGTGSILAEKLIDLFVLLVFASAGAASRGLGGVALVIAAAAVAQVAVVIAVGTRRDAFARLPLVRDRPGLLDRLFAASDVLLRRPGDLVVVSLVSLAIRAATVGVGHALLVAVDAGVPLVDTMTLWPVAILVGILPMTLGGMGTRDAAFIYLLHVVSPLSSGAAATGATVLAATMGYSVVATWSFAIIGLPFMLKEAAGGFARTVT
ncbi:MAG: lysylphosphatidylglycerol synthase transmembrane domain-containing protein, partial [Polyangiaceae bacterium]